MKKALLILGIVAIAAAATSAYAGNPEAITISVSVTEELSISLSENTWLIGAVSPNAVRDKDVIVTNDGSGVKEVIVLSQTEPNDWEAGSDQGVEIYTLKGSFDGTTWFDIPTTGTSAASDEILYDNSMTVSLELGVPEKTATKNSQDIGVTVTAQLP